MGLPWSGCQVEIFFYLGGKIFIEVIARCRNPVKQFISYNFDAKLEYPKASFDLRNEPDCGFGRMKTEDLHLNQ